MKRNQNWFRKNYLIAAFFFGILLIMTWRIGSCPDMLDNYVDGEVHPQVNKVFDHIITPHDITWDWIELYQGQAGRSPIFGALIELGLRLFGLTLFGIRIFPAILGFFSLIFTYYTMNKFYPKNLSLLFILLLSTSPWYMTMIRSGGFTGFSVSLVLLAVSAVALLIKHDYKGIMISILAGILVALLPYGYMIIRPIYLLLILLAIFYIGRIKIRNFILFLLCLVAIFSPQFNHLPASINSFFFARGESMYTSVDQTNLKNTDFTALKEKLKTNLQTQLNCLLGRNQLFNFWNPNIAYCYWAPDIVLFPRFLVPFLVLGFLICLIGFLRKWTMYYFTPLLFLGVSLVPGTLSAIGDPNLSRDSLMVAPVYFLIALSLYQFLKFLYQKLAPTPFTVRKFLVAMLNFILIIGILAYQVGNFFGYAKERGQQDAPAKKAYPFIMEYLRQNPTKRVVYREFAEFDEYGACVAIRLLGGKAFQEKIDSGNIVLVRNDNLNQLNQQIENHEFDIVVSFNPDQLLAHLTIMANYPPEPHDDFNVYYVK
jgi:hypothetical protein